MEMTSLRTLPNGGSVKPDNLRHSQTGKPVNFCCSKYLQSAAISKHILRPALRFNLIPHLTHISSTPMADSTSRSAITLFTFLFVLLCCTPVYKQLMHLHLVSRAQNTYKQLMRVPLLSEYICIEET